jgi:circadian clock protein KaiB
MPRSVKHVLRLFVAGATTRSREAVLHVRQLCAPELAGVWRLEVIDIYQQPGLARANQIVATPTLIREFPRPVRRFIGSLVNTSGLFGELNLVAKAPL